PTQHSVQTLREYGIQPDMIICRSEKAIPPGVKEKIAMFCNVRRDCVLDERNVDLTVYGVPVILHDQNADGIICDRLRLETPEPDLSAWKAMLHTAGNPEGMVEIAVVGAHHAMSDSYKSVSEALFHGGVANHVSVKRWEVDSTEITAENVGEKLAGVSGVILPDGAGIIGCDGGLAAIRWARENNVPFFGIGMGMELAALEFARNVAGMDSAFHAGIGKTGDMPLGNAVVTRLTQDGKATRDRVAVRKGLYAAALKRESNLRRAYGDAEFVRERHRNEFELNPDLIDRLVAAGLVVSGINPDSQLVEAFEVPGHPWYVAVIFHPEFKSRPVEPHPLFAAFIGAAKAVQG
ncbi:MAG: CTP synthase, partial [Planctomycetes bacterium]|nr:CTP synthase [Planctomycetota bacterium]